jgi:hypothetical protein
MLLFMSGAGKDCRPPVKECVGRRQRLQTAAIIYLKLIIEKCHNLLLFQQLVRIERAWSRI